MKDGVIIQRRTLESVYCRICGGWLCDLEMDDGRIVQKCAKCGNRMVISVHNRSVLAYKDRRKKAA